MPAIPEFREAVEKQYDEAVFWAGSNSMQANVRVLEKDGFHAVALAEEFTLPDENHVSIGIAKAPGKMTGGR